MLLLFLQFRNEKIFLSGYEKIARMLIGKGANVDAVNDKKSTTLILAALNGNTSNAFDFY